MISAISTPNSYALPTDAILADQSQLTSLNQELATGLAISNPGQDPVAASESVQITQQLSAFSVDGETSALAQTNLQSVSSVIGGITDLVQSFRQTALTASNGTVNAQDRQAMADSVNEGLQQLLQLGNSQTPDGNYLLSGSQTSTTPFSMGNNGTVSYEGDAGTNSLQIAPGLTIPTSLSGQFLLMDIPTGNGYATANAASGNTGTATVSVGGVTNLAAATTMDTQNQSYSLQFSSSGSAVASGYSVVNGSGTVVSSGSYTPGMSVVVGGSEFTIQGDPASGDTFTIAPAKNQSLFQTVQQMATLLSQGASGGAAGAQFSQGMDNVLSNFNQGLTRLLTGQAAVGSSLAQITAIGQMNTTQATNDSVAQSDLISANIPAVATAFEQGSTALQAALSAFSSIQGLNLFATLKL